MVRKLLVLGIFLLFLPFASAASTEIVVKTVPHYEVYIAVLKAQEQFEILESYNENSGSAGVVKVTYEGDEDEVRLIVNVKLGNTIFFTNHTDDLETGEQIYLELPSMSAPVGDSSSSGNDVNDVVDNSTNDTVNNSASDFVNPNISTGNSENSVNMNSSTGEEGFFSFFLDYRFLLGVLGTIIIVILVLVLKEFLGRRRFGSSADDVVTPQEERRIREAERKIMEAQQELNRIKNKKQIMAMQKKVREEELALQRKIEEDKKALARMKRGGSLDDKQPKFRPFKM